MDVWQAEVAVVQLAMICLFETVVWWQRPQQRMVVDRSAHRKQQKQKLWPFCSFSPHFLAVVCGTL
jgi:hypothetical protein